AGQVLDPADGHRRAARQRALRAAQGRQPSRGYGDVHSVPAVPGQSGREARPHKIGHDMPARPTWRGFLKISLVNIPVKVFPATESSATISFNQLHGECQTRIQQKRWCPKCNKEVPNSDIVKGYEFEKGRYVVMSDEDFDKVRTESTRVIDLVQFADEGGIDPIYVDRAYYLAPDG